jgi:hypothetical protein
MIQDKFLQVSNLKLPRIRFNHQINTKQEDYMAKLNNRTSNNIKMLLIRMVHNRFMEEINLTSVKICSNHLNILGFKA